MVNRIGGHSSFRTPNSIKHQEEKRIEIAERKKLVKEMGLDQKPAPLVQAADGLTGKVDSVAPNGTVYVKVGRTNNLRSYHPSVLTVIG